MIEKRHIYADIATSSDKDPDWPNIIQEMIIQDKRFLEDYNLGVIGVNQIDNQNWGFISFLAKLPENVVTTCNDKN